MIQKKIRVLIVDDSLLFRTVLKRELEKDSAIEVVGVAVDPYDAMEKIKQLKPEIITSDVEMPRMNGIDFLRKLMRENPIRVLLVSSCNISVFDALKDGAVDFVKKPDMSSKDDLQNFFQELISKIKMAPMAKLKTFARTAPGANVKTNVLPPKAIFTSMTSSRKLIAIGASTGGTEAILEVVKQFPKNIPGIVMTQHMPAGFTKMYADRLNRICAIEVREAKNGDRVESGVALLAPGDKQMKVMKDSKGYYVRCYDGEKVSGHCPSVDVLFSSVAEAVGKDAVGVILTGMGKDGADGLLKMKKNGAYTLGQDQESCVVYGMPMVAFNIGAVAKQAACSDIAGEVIRFLNKNT